ncbi:Uncharacterised protein [Mycobacteroides abscessus subsp. bolletii]|uniref:hypothetical protein n=1 Tax=Kocuria marina TaxID=223184 RepID=UPI0009CAD90A|nr:hypothetical protein [Kocuria marina]SLE37242.1 Uncharacterised protein [Mycobacteroides abscessus subsp. bolletii]
MADVMTLALTPVERSAVARDLRRYRDYRESLAADLWNSAVLPEPGEPDPPGITPSIEQMTESHYEVAEHCHTLAAAFESDDPVVPLGGAIGLIETVMDEAHGDELPPEVARTAMFCRVASRRGDEAYENDLDSRDEIVMVAAEPQPSATEKFALALAQHVEEANAKLSEQLAELRTSLDGLNEQLQAQRREIDQLRNPGATRRQLPNPFRSTFEPTMQAPRRRGGPSDDGPAL